MSACEKCWTEASRRAAYSGRSTADVYPEVLRENEGAHTAVSLPEGGDQR